MMLLPEDISQKIHSSAIKARKHCIGPSQHTKAVLDQGGVQPKATQSDKDKRVGWSEVSLCIMSLCIMYSGLVQSLSVYNI